MKKLLISISLILFPQAVFAYSQVLVYEKSCIIGSGEDCFQAAIIYFEGLDNVMQNLPKALEMFDNACKLKHEVACIYYNLLKKDIVDNPKINQAAHACQAKDYPKCTKLARELCDTKGSPHCVLLGYLTFEGLGVKQDKTYATELFTQSCNHGNPYGCIIAAYIYYEGVGISIDKPKSAQLHKQGAELLKNDNDPSCSNFDLGGLFDHDTKNQEYSNAAKLFYERSCKKGIGCGCFMLAKNYSKNDAESEKLYTEACYNGVANACLELGLMFKEGRGVKMDKQKGVHFFKRACDMDSLYGCNYYNEEQGGK